MMPSAASAWAGARSCRPMCALKRKVVIAFFELHDVRDGKFMARGALAFAAVKRAQMQGGACNWLCLLTPACMRHLMLR